jgi:serine/threonine-protein kinase
VSRFIDGEPVVGTIDYLAPEQAVDSSTVDTRADLYSLGATLYFLLAGHPPFPDADLPRKLHLKQTTDPSWIAAHRPDIPAGLAGVIHRLLARRPDDRFPTPGEAAAALALWADPGPDFPGRLFLPGQPAGGEPTGEPTISGGDPSPTPLPPTRRILRSQTERRPPTAGVSDNTPPPALPTPVVAETASPTRFPPTPDPAVGIDESGSPTVVLRSGPARPPSLNVMWLVVIAAALAAAVIGGVAAARTPDCCSNSDELPAPPVRQ